MQGLITAAPVIGAALEGLRVYLAGSLRTRPRWDFDRFDDAAARLREGGAIVQSPHEIGAGYGLDPDEDFRPWAAPLGDAVGAALDEVLDADLVALLPGWEESGETAAIRELARLHGIPAVRVEELFALVR